MEANNQELTPRQEELIRRLRGDYEDYFVVSGSLWVYSASGFSNTEAYMSWDVYDENGNWVFTQEDNGEEPWMNCDV